MFALIIIELCLEQMGFVNMNHALGRFPSPNFEVKLPFIEEIGES